MILDKLRAYGKVVVRVRSRRVPDLLRLLAKRPAILVGMSAYETALLASGQVETRLKTLAQIKAASLIGCPF